MGPTGGYLVGFVLGAYLAGLVAESVARPGRVRFFVAGLVGIGGIYLCGALWVATWLALGRGTGWVAELGSAWQFGVLPFIALDAGKALIASAVTLSGRSLVGFLKH